MANDNLTADDVRKMAEDIGLTRLTDAHLQDLLRATLAARARRASLRTDTLNYTDEPSHVFSLNTGDTK
jgi:hypothetical protein